MQPKIIRQPMTGRMFRLGRRRPVLLSQRLMFARYRTAALPAPPVATNYWPKAATALSQVYLNDELGDCVIAGMGHIAGVLTGNAAASPLVLTSADIVRLYGAIGGYIPGNPSTDQGCDELTALQYWQSSGLLTDGSHKISGWASVDGSNKTEIAQALWLFENLMFGVELPDAWINPMPSASGFIWDVAGAADPDNGHCFVGVDLCADGVVIDTWGMRGVVTWAAIAKYATTPAQGELYTLLSEDAIASATEKAASGFDFAQLSADFADFVAA